MNWGSGPPRLPELGSIHQDGEEESSETRSCTSSPQKAFTYTALGGRRPDGRGDVCWKYHGLGRCEAATPEPRLSGRQTGLTTRNPAPSPRAPWRPGTPCPPAACRGKGRTVPHATAPPRAMRHPVSNIRPKSQAFQRVGSMGKVTDGQEKPARGPVIGAMRLRRQRLVKVLSETDENLENLTRRGKRKKN